MSGVVVEKKYTNREWSELAVYCYESQMDCKHCSVALYLNKDRWHKVKDFYHICENNNFKLCTGNECANYQVIEKYEKVLDPKHVCNSKCAVADQGFKECHMPQAVQHLLDSKLPIPDRLRDRAVLKCTSTEESFLDSPD